MIVLTSSGGSIASMTEGLEKNMIANMSACMVGKLLSSVFSSTNY
jgi:hypothetical protein